METPVLRPLVLAAFFAVLAPAGRAAAQATFGAEFTMTSQKLIHAKLLDPTGDDDISTKEGREVLEKFGKRVAEKCPACVIERATDRYDLPIFKVRHPGKFSFAITLDPGVLEIVPSAATLEGFRAMAPLLQDLIFATGKELKQRPHIDYGGGHVHVGVTSSFANDPVLFRNFFVDWVNHSDVMKIFTVDPANAPTLLDLPKAARKEMAEALAEFDGVLKREGLLDGGKADPKRGAELIQRFAKIVESRVYSRTMVRGWTPTEKYQALNLTRLTNPQLPWEQKTIELRFFDAQKDVGEFIRIIEVLEGRIAFLRKKPGLVALEEPGNHTARETAARLEKYARESGSTAGNLRATVQVPGVRRFVPDVRTCDHVFGI